MIYPVIHMLHRKYPASDNYDIRVFHIAADTEQEAADQFMANNVVLPEDTFILENNRKLATLLNRSGTTA